MRGARGPPGGAYIASASYHGAWWQLRAVRREERGAQTGNAGCGIGRRALHNQSTGASWQAGRAGEKAGEENGLRWLG